RDFLFSAAFYLNIHSLNFSLPGTGLVYELVVVERFSRFTVTESCLFNQMRDDDVLIAVEIIIVDHRQHIAEGGAPSHLCAGIRPLGLDRRYWVFDQYVQVLRAFIPIVFSLMGDHLV